MRPAISVSLDKAKMRAVERAGAEIPGALPKIMVRSLKRTATGGRTQIDREIRAELTVKQKAVKKRITDEQKPSATNWVYRLGISKKRLSVASFRYRWSKRRGVTYSIRQGMQRRIPRGFVRDNPKANEEKDTPKIIFRRKESHDKPVPRYPLIVPRGPSLGRVLTNTARMLGAVEQTGAVRLEREILGQITFHLQRRWPK